MTFSHVDVVAIIEEQSKPLTFLAEDIVKLMDYAVREVEKLVAHGKVKNVKGGTLYGAIIYEGCVSLKCRRARTTNMSSSRVWKWMIHSCGRSGGLWKIS